MESNDYEEESVAHRINPSSISWGKQLPMLSMKSYIMTPSHRMIKRMLDLRRFVISVPEYAETEAQEEEEEDDNKYEDNDQPLRMHNAVAGAGG